MELVKLENLRDQIRIRIVMHKEYMCGYYMQPDSEYIKGFIDARKLEIIFLEKHLESILAEIEKALELEKKFSKALGLEMVDCDCERCKAQFFKHNERDEILSLAINIKSRINSFDGDLEELKEMMDKLDEEEDIAEIEKNNDSGSDMKQKLDEALSKVKDILIEFHVKDSKYCLEVHEIIEDCYRLQDEIREDVREYLKEKKENKKYTVISFIKEGRRSDGGLDSLEAAREHANRMLNVSFKVEIRESGSNKLVDQIPRTGEPKIKIHECIWGEE